MKRLNFPKKILKSRLAVGLVCVLVAVYTLYHLIGLFDGEIATYAAGVTTEKTVLHSNGYIFRDETVLTASGERGIADYAVSDGTKVAKGQTLATVYESGADKQRALARMDAQIALLEASLGGVSEGTDPSEVKTELNRSYNDMIKLLAAGESGGLSENAEDFLVALNRMDLLWQGEKAPAVKTLASLRDARENLLASCGGSKGYTAEESGYFTATVDGYEALFTMSAVETMTGDDFFDLITRFPQSTEGAYGKISKTSEWRLVLPVSEKEAKSLKEGETYEGLFEENGKSTLPLTLERIVEAPEHDAVIVIFSCDRLSEGFAMNRCQSVQITLDSVSGIYVPRSVVRRVDGVRGVYILRGNVVYFRKIEILYEENDYYLVKDGMTGDEHTTYLQVNDLIITKGKNLFDGRVVG